MNMETNKKSGHPCVSAIFKNEKGEILLQDHVKLDRFTIPGGKVDPGENCLDALEREIYEELGVVITNATHLGKVDLGDVEYPAHSNNYIYFSQDYYLVNKYTGTITNVESNKHRELIWVKPEDFNKLPRPISFALEEAVKHNYL